MKAEDVRFIENPFLKIYNIIQPNNDKLFSMLFNLIQEFFAGVDLPTLTAIASIPEQNENDISAYAGANGYLYTLIRLYKFFKLEHLQTKETEQKMSSSILAEDHISSKIRDPDFYLNLALQEYEIIKAEVAKKKKRSNLAFYMSETCTWLCGMHLGYQTKNPAFFRENQGKLIQCFKFYQQNGHNMQAQLLYGVPGFLYTILELQQHYDKEENEMYKTNFSEMSIPITLDIINSGIGGYERATKTKIDLKKLPEDFRLTYHFHKKEYLGGAHGLGGNLNIILLSMKMNDFGKKVNNILNVVSASIKFLLRHFINSNFSTSAGSKSTKLVHFCHGCPGIISCLARFSIMFPEMGIQMGLHEIIKASLEHIWNFGILKKGFGLCHGISGNAYAFISPAVQQLFPEEVENLRRKATLFALLREQKGVMKEIKTFNFEDRFKTGVSDNPYSLMLGVAGDICFTMDVLLGTGKFPGFDF